MSSRDVTTREYRIFDRDNPDYCEETHLDQDNPESKSSFQIDAIWIDFISHRTFNCDNPPTKNTTVFFPFQKMRSLSFLSKMIVGRICDHKREAQCLAAFCAVIAIYAPKNNDRIDYIVSQIDQMDFNNDQRRF